MPEPMLPVTKVLLSAMFVLLTIETLLAGLLALRIYKGSQSRISRHVAGILLGLGAQTGSLVVAVILSDYSKKSPMIALIVVAAITITVALAVTFLGAMTLEMIGLLRDPDRPNSSTTPNPNSPVGGV